MKRPPSSGPSIKIDLNKPTSRREKAERGERAPRGSKADDESLPMKAARKVLNQAAGEVGKRAGEWALGKLGLGKKSAKKGKVAAVAEEKVSKKLADAGSALGSAGAGIPKTLTNAQRAFRRGQMAAARAFRWA